jgi:hypothetical protein
VHDRPGQDQKPPNQEIDAGFLVALGTESIQPGGAKIDLLKFLHAASRRCTDLVWG